MAVRRPRRGFLLRALETMRMRAGYRDKRQRYFAMWLGQSACRCVVTEADSRRNGRNTGTAAEAVEAELYFRGA